MSRKIKRVPLDFSYPLGKVWYGYEILNSIRFCHQEEEGNAFCNLCKAYGKAKGMEKTQWECPDFDSQFSEVMGDLKNLCEPPIGDGYQLWEYTSLGAPVSPVFQTKKELMNWCSENESLFGRKMSPMTWSAWLGRGGA